MEIPSHLDVSAVEHVLQVEFVTGHLERQEYQRFAASGGTCAGGQQLCQHDRQCSEYCQEEIAHNTQSKNLPCTYLGKAA